MVRTQIQLTEQQAARLRKRAATERVSMAQLIRRCLDAALPESDPDSEKDRRRRAIDAIGFLGSGEPDLARNHDRYLAEAYDE